MLLFEANIPPCGDIILTYLAEVSYLWLDSRCLATSKMQVCCFRRHWQPRILCTTRGYAISVQLPRLPKGKTKERVFKDKKAFQFNWYTRILQTSTNAPVLILHHNDFTAQRLQKLRADISNAFRKSSTSLASPRPSPSALAPSLEPTFTVVRTGIFGAALRKLPNISLEEVERMIDNQAGSFAVLTFPSFDPPQLDAVLRAMDRSIPPKPPKTDEEIEQELLVKNADPAQPGKRMKRVRKIRTPELKLMGAILEHRVFLPSSVKDMSKLPSLDTLRAQVVGLLSSPSTHLAAILSEASGGRLARTLEGFKMSMEVPIEQSP
jgi:ribosomal protein L10